MRRAFLVALPALFLFALAASAQGLPGCSPANANERMCQAGNVCVCRMTGGLLSGIPQAFRWDCSIQNGNCMPGVFQQQSPFPTSGGPAATPSAGQPSRAAGAPATGGGPGKPEIAKAQAALARLGFNPGPADGVIGPRTRSALQAYLAKEGLPPSDRLTPEIYRRLVP